MNQIIRNKANFVPIVMGDKITIVSYMQPCLETLHTYKPRISVRLNSTIIRAGEKQIMTSGGRKYNQADIGLVLEGIFHNQRVLVLPHTTAYSPYVSQIVKSLEVKLNELVVELSRRLTMTQALVQNFEDKVDHAVRDEND